MPRVSVIVPAHNYGHFLADALDSVLAQTFQEWECIVADDGSTDNTAQVAERYASHDSRFRCLRLPRGGVCIARNAAIAASIGEFIQFLDADDRLAPSKLAADVAFLDAHPETAVVYGDVVFFRTDAPDVFLHSPGGKLSRSILGDRVHGAAQAVEKFEHYNFVHTASQLLRRDALIATGLFDQQMWGAEDWDVWMSCAIGGGRYDHNGRSEPVAFIRTHATSSSAQRGRMFRGLIGAARAFPSRPAASHWHRPTLPLIYEVALGIDDAERGRRFSGARRIWRAATGAKETLTAMRWRAYAAAALVLPGRAFFRFVSMPIPERALEMYRRVRRRSR